MKDTQNDAKPNWIGIAGSMIAITSALSIFISVLYEFGYYQLGIGIPISATPTAMSDHIKACFAWLPIALIMLATVFTTIILLKINKPSIKQPLDLLPTDSGNGNKFKPAKLSACLCVITLVISFAMTLLHVTYYVINAFIIMTLIYALQFLANLIAAKFINLKRFSPLAFNFSLAFPTIIGLFTVLGYLSAKLDIEPKKYNYEITQKENSAPKIKANILRSYDKVTFFVYSSQKLVFMQNDQIKMITKK